MEYTQTTCALYASISKSFEYIGRHYTSSIVSKQVSIHHKRQKGIQKSPKARWHGQINDNTNKIPSLYVKQSLLKTYLN